MVCIADGDLYHRQRNPIEIKIVYVTKVAVEIE
jgi:hypothetical protein